MSAFAQSLRRLYRAGRVSLKKVKEFLAEGKITTAEYDWIIGG